MTPDPRYLFLSSRHREALAHLTYAVEERRGFVQLTGEIGTGKTMMLDALVLGLDARTKVARLAHTTITEEELFSMLATGFGVKSRGGGKLEKLAEIQGFLDDWTASGRNAVLVVDEAQNLSRAVLEEIRLLSNMRSHGQCSLQIVLAGQPEFRQKLEHQDLRQLKQRIGIRYHLTPLSSSETREYIAHRLKVAGAGDAPIFDRGAIDAVYQYAGGVPRMVNIACDRALVAGYAAGARRIGQKLVIETISDIEGLAPGEPEVTAPTVEAMPEPPRVNAVGPAVSAGSPAASVYRTAARAPEVAPASIRATRSLPRSVPRWLVPATVCAAAFAVLSFVVFGTPFGRSLIHPRRDVPASSVAEATGSFEAAERTNEGGRVGTEATVTEPAGSEAPETEAAGGDAAAVVADARGPAASGTDDERDAVTESAATATDEAHLAETTDVEAGEETPLDDRAAADDRWIESADDAGGPSADVLRRPDGGRLLVSGPGGPYVAVALSSRSEDASSAEVIKLSENGIAAEVVSVDIGDRGHWYRVAVRGGYPTIEDARQVVDQLRGLGYDSAWVQKI